MRKYMFEKMGHGAREWEYSLIWSCLDGHLFLGIWIWMEWGLLKGSCVV